MWKRAWDWLDKLDTLSFLWSIIMAAKAKVAAVIAAMGTAAWVDGVLVGLGVGLAVWVVLTIPSWISLKIHGKRRRGPTSDLAREAKLDAIDHFLIETKQRRSLTVLSGVAGKPIAYPLIVRNTRPIPVDIVGYEVTILWDDKPVDTVAWRPPAAMTTAGIRVLPPYEATSPQELIRIDGDTQIELPISINLHKIGHWPTLSPKWSTKGHLLLICGGEPTNRPRVKTFNLETERYELPQDDWEHLKAEVDPTS